MTDCDCAEDFTCAEHRPANFIFDRPCPSCSHRAHNQRMQDAEKKLKAIAALVSIYDRQDEPEGQVSARRVLTAIGETIGEQCAICRSRHGSDVRHACE